MALFFMCVKRNENSARQSLAFGSSKPSRGMSSNAAKDDARLDGNVEFSSGVRMVPFNARRRFVYKVFSCPNFKKSRKALFCCVCFSQDFFLISDMV